MPPSDRPSPAPEGWHTLTPRIATPGAEQLVSFLKRVFEAEGEYREAVPSVIRIGDSRIMVGDADVRGRRPTFSYVYVADVGTTFKRAVEAGARTIEEPFDTPYGDRRATVEDEWANLWQIAAKPDR